MKFKKYFALVICIVFALSLVACKHKEHVDKNNDGLCDECGENVGGGGSTTCTDHVDANNDGVCDVCGENVGGGGGTTTVYTPKWPLNAIGFNGNGMNFGIKVSPVEEFDPFDLNYTGDSTEIKQNHQRELESRYRIRIKWTAWGDNEAWGPTRVKAINDSFIDGSYQESDIYAVNISSSWITSLVRSGSLASLGGLRNNEVVSGILANYNASGEKYVQNSTINAVTSSSNNVYGFANGNPRPDYFIYYNVDLAAEAGLEDPAELWMKGEWTVSKFQELVSKATIYFGGSDRYPVDMGFAEFTIALVASTGNQFASTRPARVNMLSDGVVAAIETVQRLWTDGHYNPSRGTQDVTQQFLDGKTIFHSGDLWFLGADNRFTPSAINFIIGAVPYPAADEDTMTPILETSSENAISLGEKGYLMKNGQYVTGLDLSNANFRIPYTTTSCYSVLDFTNGKNGITAEISANIIIDLIAGLGDDPATTNLTPDQAYRLYLESRFNREIDVEVIMSTQNSTYYEVFDAISMTVGDGSHFGPNAYWPLVATICRDSTKNVYTELSAVYQIYRQAMTDMGYAPAP